MKKIQPLIPGTNSTASPSEKEIYEKMTKLLMFSIVKTRLDIAFLKSVVSKFIKNLSRQHTVAVKTIFRYFKDSKNRGITYGGQDKLFLEKPSNSDWAGNKESQKSTLGYIFLLNRGPMSWCSKR